ncbi:hypothetical protein [Chitinimonas sp. BJYL2]|uniref:hypothetical protein n=1 Tax=Chitinimonas sp. BJYL2 TaxID=2976696 RepID=UPI0022B5C2A3|nr:hypothetical protein [Chitinimonas sp. BJYL2]
MYADVVSAIQAGMTMAPAIVALGEEGWHLYNPTDTPDADAPPHVMVLENGTLLPLNPAGDQVLQTLVFTGGSA